MTAVDMPARPLRIGLMLRAVDDVDGQGIYIRKLCEALFQLDSQNQYVAYYWRPDQVGRFADRPNVREVVVPGRNKLAWDQVLVPLATRRDRLDVLFHHKFSIPLLAPCPTVVQQRGTEYGSHPEVYTGWSGRVDRLYSRFMIPLYCRKVVRAGDAAILVDPDDVEGLASAMYRVSLDHDLAEDLRRRGLRRAEGFSWAESVRTLLSELAGAVRQGQAAHASHPA
jgi:hypothetical protein